MADAVCEYYYVCLKAVFGCVGYGRRVGACGAVTDWLWGSGGSGDDKLSLHLHLTLFACCERDGMERAVQDSVRGLRMRRTGFTHHRAQPPPAVPPNDAEWKHGLEGATVNLQAAVCCHQQRRRLDRRFAHHLPVLIARGKLYHHAQQLQAALHHPPHHQAQHNPHRHHGGLVRVVDQQRLRGAARARHLVELVCRLQVEDMTSSTNSVQRGHAAQPRDFRHDQVQDGAA